VAEADPMTGRFTRTDHSQRTAAVTPKTTSLFLSRALQRAWRGQLRALPPSPYLRDIAPELQLHHAAPARAPRHCSTACSESASRERVSRQASE